MFWCKLQEQYLETLRFTQDKVANRFTTVPQVGDLCIVYDPDEPRIRWKLAIIESKVISKDGLCRSCVVKMENTTTSRPVNHLYKLELDLEELYDQNLIDQQKERAQAHAPELEKLKNKITLEAKKSDLPEQDINEILEKINRVPEEEGMHERRPRRAAAIKAS